ncbi:hypothetical protein VPH35_015699 [Triticum aestivum]
MSPLWKTVLCLKLFAAWRSQVEFRTMTSRRPRLDYTQRCPCSGQSYLHRPYSSSHAETQARTPLLTEAPPGGHSVSAAVGGDAGGKASCLPLAREVGVRAAAGGGGNFIVSPLSIHAALALVAAGTRGKTREELLGIEFMLQLTHPKTSFACGVWVDRGQELEPEFMATAASRYAATAESVDFSSDPEQARRRVNAFVAGVTDGRIRDVLLPGSVGASTRVILANALYFNGTWSQPFDQSATFTALFHVPDGAIVRAPFMTTGRFPFEQHVAVYRGFRALKLSYKNDDDHVGPRAEAALYMLLLLPDGAALGLADLYDKSVATPGCLKSHTPAAQVLVGRFMVPKFKFTFEFEASSDMRKLGVTRAFGGGDFSGMVSGGDGLFITGMYHKATIKVDEQGTVAAAATAVGI